MIFRDRGEFKATAVNWVQGLRAKHGSGPGVLHDVLDCSAAADRDLDRRGGVRRGGRSRRDLPSTGRTAGRPRRVGGAGDCWNSAGSGSTTCSRRCWERRCCSSARPRCSPNCRTRWTVSGGRPPGCSSRACGGVIRARLLSFGMILGIGFLLIVSLAFSAGLSALVHRWWARCSQGWLSVADAIEIGLNVVSAHRGVRDDLQDDAQGAHRLARCLGRCRGHFDAVHRRQTADRPLHRTAAASRPPSGRPRRSSSSCCGSTTRRRSSCSARSSPGLYCHKFGSRRRWSSRSRSLPGASSSC